MSPKRKLSFAWLKPPPMPPDGNMSLYDHLRELRYRLVFALVAIILGMIGCSVFYQYLNNLLLMPYEIGKADLLASRPELNPELTLSGVTNPFTLQLKIIGISSLVVTSPIWLYQLWAFIVPGLLANEKKWAMIFVGTASPLFLAGVATGYLMMPKAITVLLAFTPNSSAVTNLIDQAEFLSFLIRVMLVFGISYLIPLVMLMLNVVGVLKGEHLKKFRPFIIFGAFVFAAIATPSTDPFSMIALALPLTVLMMIAEAIARANDRRRAKSEDDPTLNDKVLQELNALDEAEAEEQATLEAGKSGDTTNPAESLGLTSGPK